MPRWRGRWRSSRPPSRREVEVKNWIYLFTAYAVIWTGVLLYLLKQSGEQRRLAREIERLKEEVKGLKGMD